MSDPISESVGGCAVNVNRYLVFFSEQSGGPFWYHGFTADTSYRHSGVILYASAMFYRVVALANAPALLEFLPGSGEISEAEVWRRLLAVVGLQTRNGD